MSSTDQLPIYDLSPIGVKDLTVIGHRYWPRNKQQGANALHLSSCSVSFSVYSVSPCLPTAARQGGTRGHGDTQRLTEASFSVLRV